MKLALFDCDGTLVDSAGLIHAVMARTFEDFGLARITLDATKSIIGLTLDIAIARLMHQPHVDDRALEMTAHYKKIYGGIRTEMDFREPLFPGIAEMIATLSTREELLLGAVTGKSRRGLDQICASHGYEKTFFVSRTADDCPSKPHPAMVTECCSEAGTDAKDTVVIGDAIYDMQMAKSAGASAIGVAWGYASVSDLIEAGADHIARTPQDILDWMETHHG
ncbi:MULTISPECIES: HAD-IA family hydrolase [unclassified Rhizobium]|uniref:HAD-IA family hydrolase n=1 Tax=unclassified Rhizobium TaxID=2613769 RepID=UPI00071425A8|nr:MULTISPECIES: HAD-IA family hydrolase [unclassified Rhizobium]KQS86663.1 HAD family hydrolase [Rhizobium sp. Leaf386]KQS94082.1 HAD family hydrolase [Rhizobium sp. Leaf391]KQT99303.1 HAD family hydrolase [Rhizobium sp. Leaf453]